MSIDQHSTTDIIAKFYVFASVSLFADWLVCQQNYLKLIKTYG